MNDLNTRLENDIARNLGLGKSARSHAWRSVSLTAAAIALAVILAAVLWSARQSGDGVQYRTEPAQRASLTVTVTATGSLVPTKQVDVGIEVSGTIKTVDVDFNDQVKVGQVLARLDTTKLEAQVLQTSAALESAKAKLAQARATVQEDARQLARLEHLHRLTAGDAPSQQDLDTARTALEKLETEAKGSPT